MSTQREDFLATTEHRRPGHILYGAGFVDDLHKRVVQHIGTGDIASHYGFFAPAGIGPQRPASLPPLNFDRYWRNEKLPPGTTINGEGVAMIPSGFYHFWGYVSPLRNATSLKEIEEFPIEDFSRWDYSGMAAQVQEARKAGKATVAWVGHTYETAWQMRGLEQFLMDTIERPEWADCIMERIFRNNLVKATAAATAGVDQITCGDDVASQTGLLFSKATWRRLVHSRWVKVWTTIRAISPQTRIWYHSDGNIMDIVPEMVEAGLNILNPLQPECLDLDAIHREFGKVLTFDGTIGTQSTMPWGKPQDVRARVKEVIQKYGQKGGLIISPTHVLEPEVPLANIDAFADACREYGTFEK